MKIALVSVSLLSLVACGPSGSSVLLPGGGGYATDSELTSIDIGLPDRAGLKTQVPDIETKMNGYRLVVASSGADCTKIDEVKPYATKTIATSLRQGCDYQVTLSLGNLAAASGGAGQPPQSEKIDYESKIKPLVAANCATSGCHDGSNALSDQRTFAGLKAVADSAVTRVQSGNMPQNGSLTVAEKKLFADWQAGGFLEKATPSTTVDANTQTAGISLAATYYKNVTPKVIAQADIQGKPTFKTSLDVTLQPDGQAIGLVAGGGGQSVTTPEPNEPPQSAVQLPENKNPPMQGPSGATTLAAQFKGEYMLLDFSQTQCGYCKTEAERMNSQAALQAYFTGGKCSHATIVVRGSLGEWHNYIGGADTFVSKHSYVVDRGRGNQLAQTYLGPRFGTPTFVLIDKQGATVGQPSVGKIPESLLAQYCR